MKNLNKTLLATSVAVGSVLGTSSAFSLEQFFNVPGTRAMAMSGAFVATAGDSTAMWYNPAGLAKLGNSIDFTLEQGDIVEEKTAAEFVPGGDLYDTDSDIKYLAVAGGGMGLAYFKPYRFFNTATYNVSGSTATAEIETELSELKYGYGANLTENLRWGGTIDLISKEADINDLNGSANDDDISQLDFGFSLGLQGDVALDDMVAKGHKFSYGIMYRSGTDSEVEDDITLGKVKGVPGRPEAMNYGFGYSAPLPVVLNVPMFITFNYEIDNLVYEDILNAVGAANAQSDLEETKNAWGIELQLFPGFLQNGSLFVRFGGAEIEIDGVDDQRATFVDDIEVASFGVGIKYGKWVFDYAKETRDLKVNPTFVNLRDQELDLSAISVSYAF
ncbi:MAG TPA: hypothetical protein DIW43_08450 [Spongiibacteraceae bacterium]|nr:hypothetical protein [Spongiibacteraceae bacterium]HCS27472.1 hypothetical protein [Spongiibacteraceae bacterium]